MLLRPSKPPQHVSVAYLSSSGEATYYIEESGKLTYKPVLGFLTQEYTFILVYQGNSEFPCPVFYKLESLKEELERLRQLPMKPSLRLPAGCVLIRPMENTSVN
jgi:hypothetical protein